MSLTNFIHRLWDGIKHLFNNLPSDLKKAIHIGVVVVDAMKKVVESPVADVLTAIIPGEFDDTIKAKLREYLPKILVEMKLADSCGKLTDPAEITACAIQTLMQVKDDWISKDAQKNFFDSLAVLIARVVSDGKYDWSDIKITLKWYYDHKYKSSDLPGPMPTSDTNEGGS